MKKILCLALALTVVLSLSLSLSVTAFADGIEVSGDTSADVNAKFVPNNYLGATVTWGAMGFIYTEAEHAWSVTAEDINKVSVTNNSAHASINVDAVYSDYEDDENLNSNVFAPYIFTSHIESFVVSNESQSSTDGARDALGFGGAVLGYELEPGATARGWLMFTNPGSLYNEEETGADDMSTNDFAKVGTLNIRISEYEAQGSEPDTMTLDP